MDNALKEAQREAMVALRSIAEDATKLLKEFGREWGWGTGDVMNALAARAGRQLDTWKKLLAEAFNEHEQRKSENSHPRAGMLRRRHPIGSDC